MGILTNTAAPLSTAGNMDKITGEKKLKDLFRVDKVLHDNFLFKLHHQANFAIILFGVAFILGMNYLNGNAIECKGGGDFEKQYCWLHGAGHIDSKLSPQDIKCEAEQPADKIDERFKKLKRKANKFHWAFFICELLNILSVVICFVILDTLFAGNFMEYGSNFAAYSRAGSEETKQTNPLCNLFPSVVSCKVLTGGASGNPDEDSILCLLSNNVFNQYYFLIVWWWWVALLAVSALGLVYRVAQLAIPSLGRVRLVMAINKLPINEDTKRQLKDSQLNSRQVFFLSRLVDSLSTAQVERLLEDMHLDHVSSYPVNADKLTVVVD